MRRKIHTSDQSASHSDRTAEFSTTQSAIRTGAGGGEGTSHLKTERLGRENGRRGLSPSSPSPQGLNFPFQVQRSHILSSFLM